MTFHRVPAEDLEDNREDEMLEDHESDHGDEGKENDDDGENMDEVDDFDDDDEENARLTDEGGFSGVWVERARGETLDMLYRIDGAAGSLDELDVLVRFLYFPMDDVPLRHAADVVVACDSVQRSNPEDQASAVVDLVVSCVDAHAHFHDADISHEYPNYEESDVTVEAWISTAIALLFHNPESNPALAYELDENEEHDLQARMDTTLSNVAIVSQAIVACATSPLIVSGVHRLSACASLILHGYEQRAHLAAQRQPINNEVGPGDEHGRRSILAYDINGPYSTTILDCFVMLIQGQFTLAAMNAWTDVVLQQVPHNHELPRIRDIEARFENLPFHMRTALQHQLLQAPQLRSPRIIH